jgi:hypothetical protein
MAGSKTYQWRDPAPMTLGVLIVLGVDAMVTAAGIALLAVWGRRSEIPVGEAPHTAAQWARLLLVLVATPAALAGLLIIFWILRVSRNAHVLKGRALQNSPIFSALWWWIIPFMSVFKPVSAIDEIWEVSAASPERRRQGRWVLGVWWASWIANGILAYVLVASRLNGIAQIIKDADSVIVCATFAYIVSRISAMQIEKHTVAVFSVGPERPLSVLERLNG